MLRFSGIRYPSTLVGPLRFQKRRMPKMRNPPIIGVGPVRPCNL